MVDINTRIDALIREKLAHPVLDAVPSLIVVLDKIGNIVWFNEACQKLTGYSLEEVKDKPFFPILLLPEQLEDVTNAFNDLKNFSNVNEVYQNYWVMKDGEIKLLRFINSVIEQDGEIEYIISNAEDITESAAVRKLIEDSELHYRTLFDYLPVSVWINDLSAVREYIADLGLFDKSINAARFLEEHSEVLKKCLDLVKIIDVNARSVELYNARTKSYLLENPPFMLNPNACDTMYMQIMTMIDGGDHLELESVCQKRTGEFFNILYQWSVPDEFKNLYDRVYITISDITPLKVAQAETLNLISEKNDILKQLKADEKELLQLVTAVEDSLSLVVITNLKGAIEYVNSKYVEISGIDLEYSRANEINLFSPQYLSIENRADMMRTIEIGEQWFGECKWTKRDGEYYWASTIISSVKDENGQIINYIVNQKDTTIQKDSEEKFRQSQKLEAVGRLASGIAHDFNNVLTAISLNVEIIGTLLSKDDPIIEQVEDAMRSIDHASSIVDQLLLFGRKQDTSFVLFNPKNTIENLSSWVPRLVGAGIQFKIDVITEDMFIYANETMFDQVIVNLVVNAKDAMPRGGKLLLELSSVRINPDQVICTSRYDNPQPLMKLFDNIEEDKSNFCMIRIEDNGTGMSDSTKEMIFEPFFTTKEKGKGTGLGLSTAYGIIRDFGGHIEFESVVSKGTIFYIIIPSVEK